MKTNITTSNAFSLTIDDHMAAFGLLKSKKYSRKWNLKRGLVRAIHRLAFTKPVIATTDCGQFYFKLTNDPFFGSAKSLTYTTPYDARRAYFRFIDRLVKNYTKD